MLEPRLPSLFESPQRAPPMPPPGRELDPEVRSRAASASAAAPIAAVREENATPPPPQPLFSAAVRVASAAALVVATATDKRAPHLAPLVPHTERHPRDGNAPTASAAPLRLRERLAASSSLLLQPTILTQIAALIPPPRAPRGALLPPTIPLLQGFADAPPASLSPRISGARAASIERARQAAPETVVHVSIGRLEVRAAAGPAASARPRQGPRPGSLDDYLRQRGKVPS